MPAEREKVNVELVAPVVGGVEISDGSRVPADQKIDGGPSVLYDAVIVLTTAPAALATGVSHGGEGWYGETNDTVITNAMFLTIIFFPTIIIIFSLIQWRLDKRKHARMRAAKRRAANADWRGGW